MLKDLFVSEVRINILGLFLNNPDKQFHVRAVVRSVEAEINAVRRELLKLNKIGLLRKRQSGNRIYYTADPSNIFYPDLLALMAKEGILAKTLLKHTKEIGNVKFAVLSNAFLRGRKSTVLDVDLFIVGHNIDLDALKRIINAAEREMDKELNYTVMNETDFVFRKRKNDHFVSKILIQSRCMLIGDEEEFCAFI